MEQGRGDGPKCVVIPKYRNAEERSRGWRACGRCTTEELLSSPRQMPAAFVINSKTREQIDLDVARSFTQFQLGEPKLTACREQLRMLLYVIFFYHQDLHYYQVHAINCPSGVPQVLMLTSRRDSMTCVALSC